MTGPRRRRTGGRVVPVATANRTRRRGRPAAGSARRGRWDPPGSTDPKPRTYSPKPPGWTTSSGRGSAHQKERARALAVFVEGTPCPFGEGYCGHAPMYSWQALDLDEFPSRAIAVLTGAKQVRRLSHAECNRSAGAKLGNAMRRGKPRRSSKSGETSRSGRAGSRW